jgi:diguanylate cyclase (GGDEF)-like protein
MRSRHISELTLVILLGIGYPLGSLVLWRQGPLAAPIGDITMTVVPILSSVLVLRAAHRMPRQGRIAWSLVAAAAACWGAGQSVFAWSELVTHNENPFPGPADFFFVPASLLLAAGLTVLPSAPRHNTVKGRVFIDSLVVTTALLLSSWGWLLQPLYASGSGSVLGQALALYYPGADVIVLAALLSSLRRSSRGGRWSLYLTTAGIIVFTGADSLYVLLSFDGTYYAGMPIDAGWICGFALCAVGARTYDAAPVSSDDVPQSMLALAQPYIVSGAALVMYAVGALQGQRSVVTVIGLVVLMALVLIRQWLVVRENHQLARELHSLAHLDGLTGLANRRALDQALDQRGLLDLNGFKAVNDTYGHAAGDELLVLTAQRLLTGVRRGDLVARLGGDEFAILVNSSPSAPDRLVQHLHELVAQPVHLADGNIVMVSASIGVSTAPPATTAGELLRQADREMYRAKVDRRQPS